MTDLSPCGIRHVQMTEPFAPLAAEPGERAVMAVFWWRDLPLGSRVFTAGELPVPAPALPALAAAATAPALEARGVAPDDPTSDAALAPDAPGAAKLSVVVCTHGRLEALARCLDSLERCRPAPDEIVVVDNAPDRPGVLNVVEGRARVRYVAEPRAGLSRARNRGVAASAHDLIAFTDDDVEVAPNWLAPIQAAFADPAVGCVTGLVLPQQLGSEAAATFEFEYGGLAGSFLPASYDPTLLDRPFGEAPPVWSIGAGANLALRREVVRDVGQFDVRLGAGAAGCSEDSEFLHRALAAGWQCRYEPAAVVFHHHRNSLDTLRRQMRAYMRGHVAALLVQFGQTRRPGNLMRAFVGLPYHYAASGLRLITTRQSLRRRVFAWECLGLVEGPLALARYRNNANDQEKELGRID